MRLVNFSKETINNFILEYPVKGKLYIIDTYGFTDTQVRYLATKYNLKSQFKFNKESNYNRGSAFRGKKRPDHSIWLKDNHPLKNKHHSIDTIKKISLANKLAHKEGRLKADNFRGFSHTQEAKNKISIAGIGRIKSKQTIKKTLDTKMQKYGKLGNFNPQNNYSRCKRGHYDIGGIDFYFRSLWEANYALYLNFLVKQKQIIKWEFETDTFWFEKIKRGVRSYMPDFKVFNKDGTIEYHEVKGWMDKKSVTKIKRMATYYPKIKLIVIDQTSYKDIKNKMGTLLKFYD